MKRRRFSFPWFLAALGAIMTIVASVIGIDTFYTRATSEITYYAATMGNDSNLGMQAAPFKTVRKAGSVDGQGDTVYVRGGTYYTDPNALTKTGSANARIVIQAHPGETVVLDGAQSSDPNPDIFYVPGQYYDIKGFTIRGAKRTAINMWPGSARHIRILNNIVQDTHGGGSTAAVRSSSTLRATVSSTTCA